jgi:hypothetical protein
MPSYRIGFGSDFNLRDAKVGIGTTLGRTKLDVAGVSKADFNIAGVSTLTSYGGFVGQKQNVSVASTIGFSTSGVGTFVSVDESETGYLNLSGDFNTVSEDIIVDEGKIFQVSSGSTVSVGTLESVSIGTHFSVPNGGISARPDEPREGMVRFNDDLNTLEFYNGVEWRQFTVTGASGRGVFAGGVSASDSRVIEYINISSLGNSQNFGDLTVARYGGAGMSNSVRGVFGGGWATPSNNLDIYYVTIASEGNAIDFGVDVTGGWGSQGTSSSTRGLAAGGNYPAGTNVIDTILFATTGVKYDYGDLAGHGTTNDYRGRGMTGCNSPTRSVFFGGYNPALTSVIESKLTASDGNTVFFGDLISKLRHTSGLSSSTRGVIGSGTNQNSNDVNLIQYITISTFGNASYFGDLTVTRRGSGSVSTQTRGVLAGGYVGPSSYFNTIDYITIASTGNAVDFGDLSQAKEQANTASDSHGGLGGF